MKNFVTLNNTVLKNSKNQCFRIESVVDFLMNYGSISNISEMYSLNSSKLLGRVISFKC
jgi:hypothetical protein